MIKIIFAISISLFVLDSEAAVSRLANNCSYAANFTPSEAAPFDLDWCGVQENDDIRLLLIDIANRWPNGVFVRAPSKTITLTSNTINWETDTTSPVKTFVLLEDEGASNQMTIKHSVTPTDKYSLFKFKNFSTVKIGGVNRSITFKGTHPGLGNGNPEMNAGLLDFRIDNGSTPTLVDVRANVRNAEDYGFYITGGTGVGTSQNRVKQLNLSGLFWNAPVFIHGGVQNLWYDKENLRISDPYNRTMGWDGAVATTINGRKVGCFDNARRQVRTAGGSFYYVDKAVGGVTLEYGTLNFIPREVGAVGNSVADPFVVRIKDWGASGPQALTGYPSGVGVKSSAQAIFFKGDPAYEYAHTEPFRFVKFEMLPSDYGNGTVSNPLPTGCAPDNKTSNNFQGGYDNLIRLEANRGGLAYRSINALWDIQFEGDFERSFNLDVGPLIELAYEPEDTPGPAEPDRSFGHVVRVGSAATMTLDLYDTDTATGLGTWAGIKIRPINTMSGRALLAKNNRIKDTKVSGLVDIAPNATGSIIDNVDFTAGPARRLITVGSNADLRVSKICASAGSTIGGSGVVTYEGQSVALPFTLPATNNCDISSVLGAIPVPVLRLVP